MRMQGNAVRSSKPKKTVRWLNSMTKHNFHWIKIDSSRWFNKSWEMIFSEATTARLFRIVSRGRGVVMMKSRETLLIGLSQQKYAHHDSTSRSEEETASKMKHLSSFHTLQRKQIADGMGSIHMNHNESAFTAFTGNFSIQTAFWLFRDLALWCVSVTCAILWNKTMTEMRLHRKTLEKCRRGSTLEQQSMHASEPSSMLVKCILWSPFVICAVNSVNQLLPFRALRPMNK